MLKIRNKRLDPIARQTLAAMQRRINAAGSYADRVTKAKSEWEGKRSTAAGTAAISAVRATLSKMCIGSVRCAYCEDSAGDQVEHILPKNIFPERTFVWANYAFACSACNRPKSNRYGVVQGNAVSEFIRRRNGPIVRPPHGQTGFINPRNEDPTRFLELDLGGTTPLGQVLRGTFRYLTRRGLAPVDQARTEFTCAIYDLNREIVRAARENAFGGFRARLREYVQEKQDGASPARLREIRDDILRTAHLTVFHEMRRQRAVLPQIHALFNAAPEAMHWPLT